MFRIPFLTAVQSQPLGRTNLHIKVQAENYLNHNEHKMPWKSVKEGTIQWKKKCQKPFRSKAAKTQPRTSYQK